MDTNRLKRFATEARNILMQGVAQRLSALGFDLQTGQPVEMPVEMGGGAVFMGDTVSTEFYNRWMSLYHAITNRSVREVAEEAAYTWFNRFVAIRILSKQNFIAPVLAYESEDIHIPVIVSEARQGRIPQMSEAMHEKLMALLNDDSKTNDQFALLIVAYCLQNPIIHKCFGSIADYTEMLLPQNILADGGFVDMLNHTEFITDSDFASPELIGWLYQFYNAERKDEVFAKKGKYEAEDIAPATQIFTPNWIVKYMVENTVGRIYLDNEPYSELKDKMKYLVEPAESTPDDAKFLFDDIHALTCADLSCGSGHILNECFDLLYQCYLESGYSRRKAIEDIFRYNLTGVDLDTRAKQLAQFALLVKACQKENSFLDAKVMPRVYDMPRPYGEYFASEDELRAAIASFIMCENYDVIDELVDAITLMNDAENLGSIMIFNISERTRNIIVARLAEYEQANFLTDDIRNLIPYMKIILTLTEKYAAIVMNPPYMACNRTDALAKYAKDNYPDTKLDLFAVFMDVARNQLAEKGKYGMINMQSWMFLGSFEPMRKMLLEQLQIESMLHLGPRTFDELSGEVVQNTAFIIANNKPKQTGIYYRLIEGKDCASKAGMFLHGDNCYVVTSQTQFEQIPGAPIAYWVSSQILNSVFKGKDALDNEFYFREGIHTADNNRFTRNWFEISNQKLVFGASSYSDIDKKGRWVPYNKGGGNRRWYGLNEIVIGFDKIYRDLMSTYKGHVRPSESLYFKEGGTWSSISTNGFALRFYPKGFLFDAGGQVAVSRDVASINSCLAYLNSSLFRYISDIVMPTINNKCGIIKTLPDLRVDDQFTEQYVIENISISKQDWDAHETSWDFANNELLAVDADTYIDNIKYHTEKHFMETGEQICIDPAAPQLNSLEWRMEQYESKWERLFNVLYSNEIELNKQFIEIYGLQEELTPEVKPTDVTILQQGEIAGVGIKRYQDGDNPLTIGELRPQFVRANIIKQFISYAVGCMMGRYRLDRPGLAIAHPDAKAEEYASYQYNGGTFEIDDDGIVPLMSANCAFTDNANLRFKHWLALALGQDSLVENLNFVEKCLGKPIDEYFMKDFWKDHKKMYQNRPIYWMFASKKGAFQCIAYMHRMNAYTAERIRTNYLLPHIEWLVQKQQELQNNAANLSTAERRELDTVTKQIAECREYHDRLHVIADKQIAFDLDDGVLVNYAKFGDVVTKLK
jgi:hypothetical protein